MARSPEVGDIGTGSVAVRILGWEWPCKLGGCVRVDADLCVWDGANGWVGQQWRDGQWLKGRLGQSGERQTDWMPLLPDAGDISAMAQRPNLA